MKHFPDKHHFYPIHLRWEEHPPTPKRVYVVSVCECGAVKRAEAFDFKGDPNEQ